MKKHNKFIENYNPQHNSFDNIQYADNEDWNLLDFYAAESDSPTPLVIFAHGNTRSRRVVRKPGHTKQNLLLPCLSRGYNVAAISFRHPYLDAQINAPSNDISKAVHFLRNNSEALNIDKNQIIIVGNSRGSIALWNIFTDNLLNCGVKGFYGANAQTSLDVQWCLDTFVKKQLHEVVLRQMPHFQGMPSTLEVVSSLAPLTHLEYTGFPLSTPLHSLEDVDLLHIANFGSALYREYEKAGIQDKCKLVFGVAPSDRYRLIIGFIEKALA